MRPTKKSVSGISIHAPRVGSDQCAVGHIGNAIDAVVAFKLPTPDGCRKCSILYVVLCLFLCYVVVSLSVDVLVVK